MSKRKVVEPQELVGKYLTFILGDGEYAVDILKIQQVIQMPLVTRIPRAPGLIRGIINLRGKVVPIVSLHSKFNMALVEETNKTCIVIVEISDKQKPLILGIVIDEIKEVMNIDLEMLTETPDMGMSKSASHIVGTVRVGDKVRFILDLDEVLASSEIATLKQIY
jgi:purine-binding chemotaxis protein CheW